MLHARNLEFLRDRGTLLFTLLLPVMLVIGMGFVFGGPERPLFKVGRAGHAPSTARRIPSCGERYVEFVADAGRRRGACSKLTHQQIDLLLDLHGAARATGSTPTRPRATSSRSCCWPPSRPRSASRSRGAAVRYVDWLFPGILGMNMMFSCLFGVGYVVLRYRKSGFLKRLHATPLTAFEFLSAQVLSRLALILFVTAILYVGIGAIIGFHNAGSAAAAGCWWRCWARCR